MGKIDKYIISSSIFALFSEDFSFRFIIDIKLFYLIIIINSIILIYKKDFVLNKKHFLVISLFLAHGIITSIFINNILLSLLAQIMGISISSFYYYNLLNNYGSKYVFEIYIKYAFFIALLAIPMFYLRINVFVDGNRLNGILNEPAHYAAIMLPAVFALLKRKQYYKFLLIVITILLSKSSIGYLGLLLIIMIPMIKAKYFLKYISILTIISLFSFNYLNSKWDEPTNRENSDVFVRRIKETQESFNNGLKGKFKNGINLSTYALLSNSFITIESIKDNPLGTGLGSYHYQYDKYYSKMNPPKYLITLGESKINRPDANSLFLRLLVDLGIFSIFLFFHFFMKAFNLFKMSKNDIQQSTFFYLVVKLIREGHYFPPEFYFFLLIFLKDFNENITHTRRLLLR